MAKNSRGGRRDSGTPEAQGGLVAPAAALSKARAPKTAATTKPATAQSGAAKLGRTRKSTPAPAESTGLGSAIEAMLGSAQAAADDTQTPPPGWLQAYIDEANPSRITGW